VDIGYIVADFFM